MATIASTILPLSCTILTELVCSDCLNYLSVGPVLMYNSRIICGRCSSKEEYETEDLHISFYNEIAEKCFFKCVNHFDGCKEILVFDEAKTHEVNCEFVRMYKCCYCTFEGNGCQFVGHFNNQHSSYLAKKGTFQINLENPLEVSKRIFYNSNNIFRIQTKVMDGELEVWCQPERNSFDFCCESYQVNFSTPENNIKYVSKPLSFLMSWDKESTTSPFKITIRELEQIFDSDVLSCKILVDEKMSTEQENANVCERLLKLKSLETAKENNLVAREQALLLKETEIIAREERMNNSEKQIKIDNSVKKIITWIFCNPLKCTNCNKEILTDRFDIYFCSKLHITCANCSDCAGNGYCKVCAKQVNLRKVKQMFKNVEFTCDWQDCETTTEYWEFLLHKQICAFRVYRCPLNNCKFEGTRSQLIHHWHDRTILLICGYQFKWSFNTTIQDSKSCYFIIENLNEMLLMKLTTQKNCNYSGYPVNVELKVFENLAVFPYNYKLSVSYFCKGAYCGSSDLISEHGCKVFRLDRQELDTIKIHVDYFEY